MVHELYFICLFLRKDRVDEETTQIFKGFDDRFYVGVDFADPKIEYNHQEAKVTRS